MCAPAYEKTYFEHAAFDHNFHPVRRYTSNLVDGVLEDGRGKVGVELHVVHLACMLDLDRERCHGGSAVVWREEVEMKEQKCCGPSLTRTRTREATDLDDKSVGVKSRDPGPRGRSESAR